MSGADSGRRSLDELKTLYTVNADLRDLIVEGRSDARFFKWFLRETGATNSVQIYAVDDRAEIPAEVVLGAGAEVGARGRVLALASLAADWEAASNGVTGVIDADRWYIEGFAASAIPPTLLVTEWGSLDVYALQERPMQQFFDLVLGSTVEAINVIPPLVAELNEVFACRAALHQFGVAMIDTFPVLCGSAHLGASVDSREILRRSLVRVGRIGDGDVVEAAWNSARTRVAGLPPLAAIRGHDIAPLLIKWLGLRNEWSNPRTVEGAMRGSLEVADLVDKQLFVALHARLGV